MSTIRSACAAAGSGPRWMSETSGDAECRPSRGAAWPAGSAPGRAAAAPSACVTPYPVDADGGEPGEDRRAAGEQQPPVGSGRPSGAGRPAARPARRSGAAGPAPASPAAGIAAPARRRLGRAPAPQPGQPEHQPRDLQHHQDHQQVEHQRQPQVARPGQPAAAPAPACRSGSPATSSASPRIATRAGPAPAARAAWCRGPAASTGRSGSADDHAERRPADGTIDDSRHAQPPANGGRTSTVAPAGSGAWRSWQASPSTRKLAALAPAPSRSPCRSAEARPSSSSSVGRPATCSSVHAGGRARAPAK